MSESPAPAVPVGYRVGRWEVTGFLAAGSWGSVHAARRQGPATGGEPQEAALKVLSTAGLAPRQARELLETAEREVEFSGSGDHHHLIRVHETVLISDPAQPELDGAVVLVMDRADRSLQDSLADLRPENAGALLVEVAEGLAHLHRSGWVHGDLKPANILLMPDGTARVADFGLAARLDGTHGYAPPMGTPDYLPPERRNERLSERGVATRPSVDIWAYGITAHQVLTGGQFPFPGTTPAARAAAAREYAAGRSRLRLAAEIAPGWREVITECLAADPGERGGPTMETVLPGVRAAAAGTAVPRRRPGARLGGRRAVAAAAAGVLLVAGAVTTAVLWPSAGGEPAGRALPAQVRVFNVDGACKEQTDRLRACSIGLARDPRRKYDADNVVAHRIWHGDVLTTDCVVNDGDRVEDETGIGTPRWYRVLLDDVPEGHAWLPAVRTHDDPAVPVCSASDAPTPAPTSS